MANQTKSNCVLPATLSKLGFEKICSIGFLTQPEATTLVFCELGVEIRPRNPQIASSSYVLRLTPERLEEGRDSNKSRIATRPFIEPSPLIGICAMRHESSFSLMNIDDTQANKLGFN